jgi:ABC-type sugar transport system permease subunit
MASVPPDRIASPVLAPGLTARRFRLSERWFASLLILPAFLVISLVVLFPLAYSLWMSFADVNLLRATGPALELFGVRIPLFRYVGVQNYLRLLTDPNYWDSFWRTAYFVGAFVVETTVVGSGWPWSFKSVSWGSRSTSTTP